jgi:hypothetical protein
MHAIFNWRDVPEDIVNIALAECDLRYQTLFGTSALTIIMRSIGFERTIKLLPGRAFHLLADRYGSSPLSNLTDEQVEMVWRIGIDNYLSISREHRDNVRRPEDLLCADNPTDECWKRIMRRLQRTGICYPTPAHWTRLQLPELDFSDSLVYHESSPRLEVMQIAVICARNPDVVIPFLFPDYEMNATTNFMERFTHPVKSVAPWTFYVKTLAETHVFNHIRIYYNSHFAIDPTLTSALRNAAASGKRYVFVFLTYYPEHESGFGHANALVIDTERHILERSDSNGASASIDLEHRVDENVHLELLPLLERVWGCKFTYTNSVNAHKRYPAGVAFYNGSPIKPELAYEPPGYCGAWSLLFLEIRATNPDLSMDQIIALTIRFCHSRNIGTHELIRAYARALLRRVEPILRSVGMSLNDYMNRQYVPPPSVEFRMEKVCFPLLSQTHRDSKRNRV